MPMTTVPKGTPHSVVRWKRGTTLVMPRCASSARNSSMTGARRVPSIVSPRSRIGAPKRLDSRKRCGDTMIALVGQPTDFAAPRDVGDVLRNGVARARRIGLRFRQNVGERRQADFAAELFDVVGLREWARLEAALRAGAPVRAVTLREGFREVDTGRR